MCLKKYSSFILSCVYIDNVCALKFFTYDYPSPALFYDILITLHLNILQTHYTLNSTLSLSLIFL